MSAKNRLENKRGRRMRKALRVPLRAQIDLEDYLVLHGHAKTKAYARKLIHERRVKSESHILGFTVVELKDKDDQLTGETEEVYNPFVPASVRPTLTVLSDEDVASSKQS